jgi:RND superfamily putative drug exporter
LLVAWPKIALGGGRHRRGRVTTAPPETPSERGLVGVFQRLGRLVVRWPWLVIVIWVALAAFLPMMFPSLNELVQRRPVAILPADAPSSVTAREMTKAFNESGSDNVTILVLTDESGLNQADEVTYSKLVGALRKDSDNVVMIQDFITTPPLREILTSKDNKAWIVPVGLAGDIGSPRSYAAFTNASKIVTEQVAGSSLTANLTGPAATVADLTISGEKDQVVIEIATATLLLTILLLIYRNIVTILMPLLTIGISLTTAQGVVAGLASLGLSISNQTIVFLTALMAGAGTDYAVFLIGRYHDYLRMGEPSDSALQKAMGSIGVVIAASAATVAVTFLGMVFTRLALFSTVGVALAFAIGVAFLAAVTFLPAVMVLVGRRGWIKPRRELSANFWRRSGIRIVRRPRIYLAASLVLLTGLASSATLARYNYDDRAALPPDADSSVGYAALDRHFPLNQAIPQYLFIQSPIDLRTPEALADLEQMAQRISQIPGVAVVRGITRPTGESLEQARLSFQAGEVGIRMSDAANQIQSSTGDLDRLNQGVGQLASALGTVRGQVGQAILTVRGLVDTLSAIQAQFGGSKTFDDIGNAAGLLDGIRSLGTAIETNSASVADLFTWADPVYNALNGNPVCDNDPACVQARNSLSEVLTARDNGTLEKIKALSDTLKSAQGDQTLGATADNLRTALNNAEAAIQASGLNNPAGIEAQLGALQAGADKLADASRQIADGVGLLVDSTKRVGSGLRQASDFLLAMKTGAAKEPMAGFFIPPQFLAGDEFRKAAQAFISSDGHAVRYLVQNEISPFSTQAMDLVQKITETAQAAQPNTQLEGASISMAGFPALLRDIRDNYNHDIRLIIGVTLLVVLVILVVLLRALVAPLYLIASVVISYMSALGIGVLVFQVLLGQELHWSVPGLTFIILVAVGADYNMLLISRIREESPHGVRFGVIRTVSSTGGVITAAGLIFAASMFGLLFASISTLVQAGFVVGVGILLDTFLVRTVTVPAVAAILGPANWWPSRPKPTIARPRVTDVPPESSCVPAAAD